MKMRLLFMLPCLIILSGCIIEQVDAPCRVANTNTDQTNDINRTGIANPASKYCVDMGYKNEIRKNNMGEYGVCIFTDSSECDEWKFFRGECGRYFNKDTAN